MVPDDIQAHTDKQILTVTWTDVSRDYSFQFLRGACQCAHCVDEWSGKQLLDVSSIPADIAIEKMELVGNYALRITWSDGHQSGLTLWQRLRGYPATMG